MKRLTGLLLLAGLYAGRSDGIDVFSLYSGSCQVESGVVVGVDRKTITLVNGQGKIQVLDRHQVVAVARYPLPRLPISQLAWQDPALPKVFRFYSQSREGLALLATGWPLEYSTKHIQILETSGQERLVARSSIWQIDSESVEASEVNLPAVSEHYLLRHPLNFETCPAQTIGVASAGAAATAIIPNEIWTSPVSIRRHFDRLFAGSRELEAYEDHQKFYAVPNYFTNTTRLGTWAVLGSRYTQVGARKVNFLPLVEDESNDGPFSFQSLVRSGVAPLAWSLHEEPLLQVLFSLKADYLSLSAFTDPSYLLIRSKYKYTAAQLDAYDIRFVENGGINAGVDLGPYSLRFGSLSGCYALSLGGRFLQSDFAAPFWGLEYRRSYFRFFLYQARAEMMIDEQSFGLDTLRLGANWQYSNKQRYEVGYLARQHRSTLLSANASTYYYEHSADLSYRLTAHARLSYEQLPIVAETADGTMEHAKSFWKLAGGVTFSF